MEGKGVEVTEDLVGCIGLDFVGGFYFFSFLSFYVLLFFFYLPYLCAGHFERVSFSFLTCIVLYSFLSYSFTF